MNVRDSSLPPPRLTALPGSERAPLDEPGPTLPADDVVEATLVLRRRAELPAEVVDGATPALTRDELAGRYGADPADITLVTDELTGLGIRVLDADPASRLVRISGTVAQINRAFGTELTVAPSGAGSGPAGTGGGSGDADGGSVGAGSGSAEGGPASGARTGSRRRGGGLSLPVALDGVVTAVLGLDDRPQARTRFQLAPNAAVSSSYTPVQLGKVYGFPAGTDGTGQSIAIIELGGGFEQAELDTYFAGLGVKPPAVTSVGVDGGRNRPEHDPNGADGEVLLDIEVAAALAPGAQVVVYFAPNTDAGFLDAVVKAAHADPAPAAISISWGAQEEAWTAQARSAMDGAFADAAALGVTVTAAAGDDGSTDRARDGLSHVDFPAASPHVLACGGTSLRADTTSGVVTSETVWNNGPGQGATGGGISAAFPRPAWQTAVKGRGVPDVAAVADPATGYRIRVDGQEMVIGGTSAVAPLWAALAARLAQGTGRPTGLLQPTLYGLGGSAGGFRDITVGSNGAYSAAPGWDACTGLGVPVGEALLAALRGASARDAGGDRT
ncbi:MAG TPA: S53 family peptidase [Pseudonocardia sp.]|nr:S53 family peptidase [Pseudonocardia sp.]